MVRSRTRAILGLGLAVERMHGTLTDKAGVSQALSGRLEGEFAPENARTAALVGLTSEQAEDAPSRRPHPAAELLPNEEDAR
jgi:hypothetical protein